MISWYDAGTEVRGLQVVDLTSGQPLTTRSGTALPQTLGELLPPASRPGLYGLRLLTTAGPVMTRFTYQPAE